MTVPEWLNTPKKIASELESIRERLMTYGIVSGERLYGCDEWSEPTVRLQKVIDALQAPAADGEVVNQCDGCRAGFPVDKNGHHIVPYPSGSMACEKDKYTAQPRVVDVELAAKRVVAAFEANGKANNFNINIHRECEQSMLALKAALEAK